jgi:hypothetical protein
MSGQKQLELDYVHTVFNLFSAVACCMLNVSISVLHVSSAVLRVSVLMSRMFHASGI